MRHVLILVGLRVHIGGLWPEPEDIVIIGARVCHFLPRRRLGHPGRVVIAAALAALFAVPATATVSQASPAAPRAASASCPWVTSRAPVAQRVAQLMARMSLADEISMVEGHGTSNPYVFYTPAIPALCIPAVGEEDGPAGVADGLTGVTQPPAGVALAATWDPSLADRYGQVIGAEEYGKGASVNLGPTVNIDRDPRWGRSFEARSEEPFLNSALSDSEIGGVQSRDVLSQVKHLAVYNRSEEHTSELQSHVNLVCRLLLEKKKKKEINK